MKTFVNKEGSSKFNAATIGMLYTYWHEISKDGITHPTIDEQKEIEELVSLLPTDLVITQITMMELPTKEFAYTYIFQRPCNANFPPEALENAQVKLNAFFNMINDLTDNEGHYCIVPIRNTNVIIGSFTIG